MKGKTSSSLLSNRKFGAKVRINERNAKGKLKFFFSFPSESTFGVAKVRLNERKTNPFFSPFLCAKEKRNEVSFQRKEYFLYF